MKELAKTNKYRTEKKAYKFEFLILRHRALKFEVLKDLAVFMFSKHLEITCNPLGPDLEIWYTLQSPRLAPGIKI